MFWNLVGDGIPQLFSVSVSFDEINATAIYSKCVRLRIDADRLKSAKCLANALSI